MKLKNLPDNDPFVSYNFRLRKTVSDRMVAYLEFCRKQSGNKKLSMPEMLAAVAETFLDSDREFVQSEKGDAPPARASATTTADKSSGGMFGGRG